MPDPGPDAAAEARPGGAGGTRFAGGPGESPGFLLWRVTTAWQRAMTAALAPLGLTHVQFVLLACSWWLGRGAGAPHQAEIAAQAGADARMTSDVLSRLEAKGLIRREGDPDDSRAKVVRVTAEGARVAQRAVAVVEGADAVFFEGADAGALVPVLRRLGRLDEPARTADRGGGPGERRP